MLSRRTESSVGPDTAVLMPYPYPHLRYMLDEVNSAFEHFSTGEPIKVIIKPAGDDDLDGAECEPCE
mgnify:FL=1